MTITDLANKTGTVSLRDGQFVVPVKVLGQSKDAKCTCGEPVWRMKFTVDHIEQDTDPLGNPITKDGKPAMRVTRFRNQVWELCAVCAKFKEAE